MASASIDADSAVLPDSMDAETCRICRGEGSAEEPLFYPCKCSGSIKFVHQDCLMEWLSHSQKKYCELCKTPFRFTKLYHPQMPRRLPTSVFLRKAAMHLLSQVLLWCRAVLVISVWLVLLPLTMRVVWRFFFWFIDSGYARAAGIETDWPEYLATSFPTNYSLPKPIGKLSQLEHLTHSNLSHSLVYRMFKSFILGATHSSGRELHFAMTANSSFNSTTHQLIQQKYSSILSNVTFFRELTPSVALNRSVMDIVEGLIITLSVVVAFILVFLIREWVIQQQPLVNGDGDAENRAAVIAAAREQLRVLAEARRLEEEAQNGNANPDSNASDIAVNGDTGSSLDELTPSSSSSDSSALDSQHSDVEETENHVQNNRATGQKRYSLRSNNAEDIAIPEDNPDEQESLTKTSSRPDMPSRGRSFLANDIFRGLEERGLDQAHHGHSSRSDADPVVAPIQGESSIDLPRNSLDKGKARADGSTSSEDIDVLGETKPLLQDDRNDDIHDQDWNTNSASAPPSEDVQAPEGGNQIQADVLDGSENLEVIVPAPRPEVPHTWTAHLYDWFWGDIAQPPEEDAEDRGNDERVVNDIADEEPFVPFADAQPVFHEPEVPVIQIPAPNADGGEEANEGDAAEDVEDLEGILELIGMQGPITGLFQNAIFSALLISATMMSTILVPYWLGKIELLFLGNPSLMWQAPVGILSGLADMIADVLLFVGGFLAYFGSRIANIFAFGFNITHENSRSLASRAGTRLTESTWAVLNADPSASLAFSMISHASLLKIKSRIRLVISTIKWLVFSMNIHTFEQLSKDDLQDFTTSTLPTWMSKHIGQNLIKLTATLQTLFKTGKIHVKISHDFNLQESYAYWSAGDKAIAILVGYACVALCAAFYVAYLAPLTSSPQSKRFELAFVEVINQAGGVCKVIFIISIEMIAFPLFCGFLLDLALLPLFESAGIGSRLSFTYFAPWTSGFVHWFVGTCYMFHFALFVSMCRKIMRTGVLYFIRDPDDPTFHPVRDVLERSVTVQLRKIAFSAVVYGTLIVICLGGVVWSLKYSSNSILPIHWTSSESEREFPLDILFFNFLTPVIVKYTKPTDGLHAMYQWWFRRCARALRLSHFLFGIESADEEGRWVGRSWKVWFMQETGLYKFFAPKPSAETSVATKEEATNSDAGIFQFDGRYARVPASDQIRIPKGNAVFVEVDKSNNRLDGVEEHTGTHSKDSRLITKIYIPPLFKARISLFVLAVWLFAAATGVSVTIVPLLFGRWLFSVWMPSAGRVNDIYAFSLGIYLLGALIFLLANIQPIIALFRTQILPHIGLRTETLLSIGRFIQRAASFIYVYATFAIAIPILMTSILQLYILLPIHTYIRRGESHIVHIVQDWTLGILYLRILTKFFLGSPTSLGYRVFTAVTSDGYLSPNARLATRALILPTMLAFAVLTFIPYAVAQSLNKTVFSSLSDSEKSLIIRLAYPTTLGFVWWVWLVSIIAKATSRWRQRIKDEVYLIGERLHNFGEKKSLKNVQSIQSEETSSSTVTAPQEPMVETH